MKYFVILKRIWPDGSCTEINASPKNEAFDNFSEAAKFANEMNNHEWRFHQEHANVRFHYVKEI